MPVRPKYSLPEFERRWLVPDPNRVPGPLVGPRQVEDRYLVGTRLRLRRVTDAQGRVSAKLGKKYGAEAGAFESIVNIYLDMAEYARLAELPAYRSRKRRYSLEGGSLDVYVQPRADLCIFEIELASAAEIRRYRPPSFVGREITGDSRYSGFAIALEGGLHEPSA